MPAIIEYVCQRCRRRARRHAAQRPPSIQPCPSCTGTLQAIRLVPERERTLGVRRRVRASATD